MFDDGETVELALLGACCLVFPAFTWERGKGGKVLDCPAEAAERQAIEEFLARQRRFQHLMKRDAASGAPLVQPGRTEVMERLRAWTQGNVDGSTLPAGGAEAANPRSGNLIRSLSR